MFAEFPVGGTLTAVFIWMGLKMICRWLNRKNVFMLNINEGQLEISWRNIMQAQLLILFLHVLDLNLMKLVACIQLFEHLQII